MEKEEGNDNEERRNAGNEEGRNNKERVGRPDWGKSTQRSGKTMRRRRDETR